MKCHLKLHIDITLHYPCGGVQSGAAADGSYLLAVDDGDKRTLVIWEWTSRRLIARTVVSHPLIAAISVRFLLILQYAQTLKTGKGSPYSITERMGFRS